MQKIAFTIFEIAKQAIIRKIPQDQLLQAVEHHVVKVYQQSIEELEQKGVIDEDLKNRAVNQSNIDAMAQQAKAEQERKQQEIAEESARNAEEAQKRREERRAQKRAEKETARQMANIGGGITNKQMKLMSLALVLKILNQDKVTTILNKFDSNDSLAISQYMNMADLESKLDGDLITTCLADMRGILPVQRKLTKENVVLDLLDIYKVQPREKIEKILKRERPLIKRFIATAYEGEYGELPLRVAGVVTEYIKESV